MFCRLSHCAYGIIATFLLVFVGYILLSRWTVWHGFSAAILRKKKKKTKNMHRYTYLKRFICPFRKPLLVICNTTQKPNEVCVCIHAYMCIKLYKVYLNMHMGIVKVMSVKCRRMLFTCTLRSPLMLGMRTSSKITCSLKFEQLMVIVCNRCQSVVVAPTPALILTPNLLTFQSSLMT